MYTLTQKDINEYLSKFAMEKFERIQYLFIPCIECSREFHPADTKVSTGYGNYQEVKAYLNANKYYMHYIPVYNNTTGTYTQVDPNPLKYTESIIKSVISNCRNWQYENKFAYETVPDEVFLEFDFKERYASNKREKLFGNRDEAEAWKYYLETCKHNSFLISEMKLAMNRTYGDMNRALNAYKEFTGESLFNNLAVKDFPKISGKCSHDCKVPILKTSVDKNNLKITDFYNIVPDNPSIDDLVKVYNPRKEFLKTIPTLIDINKLSDMHNKRLYHEYCNQPLPISEFNNMHMFLLAIFTREEFEEMLFEELKRYYSNYSNCNEFKSQCTIQNLIREYKIRYEKESTNNPRFVQAYANHWPEQLAASNGDTIVIKLRQTWHHNYMVWYADQATIETQ